MSLGIAGNSVIVRLAGKLLRRSGRLLHDLGHRLLSFQQPQQVWIDVGAHVGRKSFPFAYANPSLIVYACEPNLKVARQTIGRLPNYIVLPMAVTEHDGCADFYLNEFDAASSLYPFNPEGLEVWVKKFDLKVIDRVKVPTVRLDTFMNAMNISRVDYLKVDAQGADFAVIKSAGDRLVDIQKVTLEVAVTPIPLYDGAAGKDEIVDYLRKFGFTLINVNEQDYNQEQNLTFVNVSASAGDDVCLHL